MTELARSTSLTPEHLDSAGIAMIFRLAERLKYNRQELRLVIPQDAPIRVRVRLTKLDQVIPVHHTLTDDLRRLRTCGLAAPRSGPTRCAPDRRFMS
jgi:hypothetical protein